MSYTELISSNMDLGARRVGAADHTAISRRNRSQGWPGEPLLSRSPPSQDTPENSVHHALHYRLPVFFLFFTGPPPPHLLPLPLRALRPVLRRVGVRGFFPPPRVGGTPPHPPASRVPPSPARGEGE